MSDSNAPGAVMSLTAGTATGATELIADGGAGTGTSRPGCESRTAGHEEAIRLLELGYRPIAVDPTTKAPWYPWKPYQTRQPTEDEIAQWYAERPDAGVGITTEGLIVVDVDGPDTVWPPNRECCYDLMGVPQVSTPRGGSHFYFRQLPGKPHAGTIGKLQPNVDTRANGNLVVLPPTKRPGVGDYEWVGEALDCGPDGLPSPPDWLQSAIDAIDSDRVSLYVSKPFSEAVPQGQRNRTFFRLACLMRDTGCDEAMILGALEGANSRQPDRLGGRELAAIAKSASKYEPTPRVDISDIMSSVTAAGAGAHPKSVRALTLAELEDRPAPVWLIEGVIPDNGLGFLIGDPGSGKSFLLLGLAFAVGCSLPLLGTGPAPNRTGWVLLLLAEGSGSWATRSKAIRAHPTLFTVPA